MSNDAKKIIRSRNALFHRVHMCLYDPMIMLYAAIELRRWEHKYMGMVKRMHLIDIMFLTWASTQPFFKNKGAKDAIKGFPPHLVDVNHKLSGSTAVTGRLYRHRYIDRSVHKGSKTWFITTEGKLFLIDITADLRKVALRIIKTCKKPKPLKRKRPIY